MIRLIERLLFVSAPQPGSEKVRRARETLAERCPDPASGNIACKLLRKLGGAHTVGPILAGMKLPLHVLQEGCEVEEVVSIAALAAIDAERHPHAARQ